MIFTNDYDTDTQMDPKHSELTRYYYLKVVIKLFSMLLHYY